MNGDDNKLVFVSYAHKDKEFLDTELMPFLEQLKLGEQIELWHDRLIGIGEDWYAEIADRLDEAKVAILLITPEFLASKFCHHEEVPVLLQRARRGEIRVLPLLAEPCLWDNELWLRRLQIWPRDDNAVSENDGPTRKRLVTEFARRVRDAVDAPAEAGTSAAHVDEPHPRHDLHRMPQTGSLLFGRRNEFKLLNDAWDDGSTNIVAFSAGGGVGKSTLVRVWAEMLAEDEWRGAERAFAWSFYSQGTGRMTDAEGFINEALEWFGDDTAQGLSPWERGERLANCVRRRRTLLILDGVEPLQSGEEGVDRGCVRDPDLRTLLEELAKGHSGLCVVTTRERLTDLEDYCAPAVLHRDLDQVSKLAGRALLRIDRIRGDDKALEASVEDFGGHALAISLLSKLLTDENAAPHISNAKALPELTHPVEEGGHARRILDAWANRLGDSEELELLQIIGLFDHPADHSAVQAVIDGDPLPGLNRYLRAASLDDVLGRLRKAGLIARESTHEATIDTHPIVRQHFDERLVSQLPKSWGEGHRTLYEHHKNEADFRPDNLAGMQPLFAAVVHGCAAGLHQEVCEDVFLRRIRRGKENYLIKKLGAYAADLSCLSHFFADRWTRPEPAMTNAYQTWAIAEAGFGLTGLGRLREAIEAMEEALSRSVKANDWKNASIDAANLSERYLLLGEITQAEAHARDAVDYVDRCGGAIEAIFWRAAHADALHHLGQTSDARALFTEAERMQAQQDPSLPILYSGHGYQYCDFLLSEGETDDVIRRVKQTLRLATKHRLLRDIALDNLNLGRAYMTTSPSNSTAAKEHLRAAVDGLRTAGCTHEIPLGLLARAAFHRTQDNLDLAERDLEEARKIVRQSGMRLFEADLELEQSRWHLAKNDPDSARDTLGKAKELIESMDYGRRRPEVEHLESELA